MAYGPVNVPGSGTGSAPSVTTIDVPVQHSTLTYNGEVQAPLWDNYNPNAVTVTGETSGTNAGTYTAIFTQIQISNGVTEVSLKNMLRGRFKRQRVLFLSAQQVQRLIYPKL